MDTSRVVGVLGANGFIGRHLVRRLRANNIPVIAFGRNFPPDYDEIIGFRVDTRIIDLTDVLETHALLQGVTTVVQLINSSSPGMANNRVTSDITVNILPQVSFIESCIMAGVGSFVFMSSGGTIYGNPHSVPISEDHPTRPLNSYGMTKKVVEQYLDMLTGPSAMGYAALRVSNPFGPGQDNKRGQGLVATVIKNHERGLPVTVWGDGTSLRDYIYIDDLIDAIMSTMDRPAVRRPINIGSGVGKSILDVIGSLERAIGEPIMVEFTSARPTDASSNVLDPTLAADLLGWRAQTSFDEGIARTVAAWNVKPRGPRGGSASIDRV
ncbi:NAD-dependent epimerase/dehydratase family protein [Sphingomonas qilianensis]|uniref:UDP-glucose 4-epimerase n=1 Tax=Sphingomonas qilianensis TaxID=1736690 RepID=A0ABU9XRD0_9SPHN